MIGRLNHVAIAVPDLEAAAAQYRNTLGAEVGAPQDEPDHGVTVVFITLPNTKIELLYPLGENSPIQGFLDKNPSGGIHHICYEVEDILAARDKLIADPEQTLNVPTEDEVAAWRTAAEPLLDEWKAAVTAKGGDADAILDGYVKSLEANDARY